MSTRVSAIRRSGAAALAAAVALAACGPDERPAAAAGPVPTIAAGGARSFVRFGHSCAVIDGGVQCWGSNGSGQLGDGFLTRRVPVPVRVPALRDSVTAIAAGGAHSCAIRLGAVWCWGQNDRRQIASLRPALFTEPSAIAGLPEGATSIAAGDEHSCAIVDRELYCWGRGTHGELGRPLTERCGGYRALEYCSETPIRVDGLPAEVSQVSLGVNHTCAIAAGRLYCWGRNDRGQLGVGGDREIAWQPLRVEHAGAATAVAAGDFHTCALIAAAVHCWGAGDAGQLGNRSKRDSRAPVQVAGLEAGVTGLAAGARHSCAIREARAWCWGANESGQLGDAGPDRSAPVAVSGIPTPVAAIAAGADHSCSVGAGGKVRCWGANDFGQLGNGEPARSSGPVDLAAWDTGGIRDRNGDGRIRVVCLGDSNTQIGFRFERTWCERLETRLRESGAKPEWETRNRGWSGATAVSSPSLRRAEEPLEYTLEFDAPDVIVLAFGTNDLIQNTAPEKVLAALLAHLLRAREEGVDTFVGLVPPARGKPPEFDASVEALNALIRRAIAPARVVDFSSELGVDDLLDDVHLDESGQDKWAQAAADALQSAR